MSPSYLSIHTATQVYTHTLFLLMDVLNLMYNPCQLIWLFVYPHVHIANVINYMGPVYCVGNEMMVS